MQKLRIINLQFIEGNIGLAQEKGDSADLEKSLWGIPGMLGGGWAACVLGSRFGCWSFCLG